MLKNHCLIKLLSPFFIQFYNYDLFYGMHMVEILTVTFKHALSLLFTVTINKGNC